MPIFIKENQELKDDMFKLPKNVLDHLNTTLSTYGKYSKSDGYKRLNTLVNNEYNKRSDKEDRLEDDGKHISYSDLKRINFDFDKIPQNNEDLSYILNGGSVMKDWVRSTLRQARNSVKSNLKTKKQDTIKKNILKPVGNPAEPIKVDDKSTVYIHESSDGYHPFYDRLEEYNVHYIFDAFKYKANIWIPLINPNMYAKALEEFTKYGQFINFPTKYIYQWMGIIMKNTALLIATTDIAGHSQNLPMEEFIDEFFYNEDEDGTLWEEYKNKIGEDDDYSAMWEYLSEIGYDEWQGLPDGSDAISDFGIEPICKIINEYNDGSTPEQTIVIINKILDVSHQRGDLPSIFITGGGKSLYNITYRQNESKKKKIIVKEEQLLILKNIIK